MNNKESTKLLLRQILDRAKRHPYYEVRLSADEKKAIREAHDMIEQEAEA